MPNAIDTASTKTTRRYTVNVGQEVEHKLEQILQSRPRTTSMNDIIREALDLYLNAQEDLIGSRQHFSRSLQRRIGQLETEMTRSLNLIIFLTANGFAQVVHSDPTTGKPSQATLPGWYIRSAIEGLLRDGDKLNEQLRTIQKAADAANGE